MRKWAMRRREAALNEYLRLNGQRFSASPRLEAPRKHEPTDSHYARRAIDRDYKSARRRLKRADLLLDVLTLNGRV